jgi:RNA polymerase sigma-70 factor (ECF subfamily)
MTTTARKMKTTVGTAPVDPGARPDDDLRAMAKTNREYAIHLLVQRYRTRLYSHAYYIVKDSQEAYDAVQEVFIKAMRQKGLFDDEFRIKAWLFRVTSNLCYNIYRDRKRRGGILETLPRPSSAEPCQDDQVHESQMRDQILNAMDDLSRDHREILLLRYYDDLSYAEIADVLTVALGTVMSRLSRARTRLGQLLGPDHVVVLHVLEGSRHPQTA